MTMTAPPEPQKLEDIQNQTLVQIAIRKRKIHLYPQRASDAVVYHKAPTEQASPVKPEQVRWVVGNLAPNQQLRIEAKPSEEDIFAARTFVITGDCNTILSGEPRRSAGYGRELRWNYSITLVEDGRPVDTIDPTIIIKDDP